MEKLDVNYFYGPLTIPQVTDQAVARNLAYYFATYEIPFLKLLLGEALYNAYNAGLAEVTPAAKWTALQSEIYNVVGSIPNQIKVSVVANYVYWFYMRDMVTQSTGSGEKIAAAENATNASSVQKVKLAWNMMAKRNREIHAWLKARVTDYPEWVEPVADYSTPEAYQLYSDRRNILKTVITFF